MTEPVDPPSPPEWAPPPPIVEPWDAAPGEAEPSPGFARRNWLALVACALAAVAIVLAAAALGSNSSGSTAAAATAPAATGTAAPAPSAPASTGKSGAANRATKATRATIVSESGSSWTVHTAKGETITVAITPQTQFGTPKAPATAANFAVGADVVITGVVDNGTATATRVAAAKAAAPSASTSPTQS